MDANVAVDYDFTAAHGLANTVEPSAAAFDANLSGISHAQAEYIADPDAMLRRLHLDALDLRGRLAGNQMRNKWRQIESLIRWAAQCERQRSHGSRSRKW
jgi:hypothetical protein